MLRIALFEEDFLSSTRPNSLWDLCWRCQDLWSLVIVIISITVSLYHNHHYIGEINLKEYECKKNSISELLLIRLSIPSQKTSKKSLLWGPPGMYL